VGPNGQKLVGCKSGAQQAGFEDGRQWDVLTWIVHGHEQGMDQAQVRVIEHGPARIFTDWNRLLAQGCCVQADNRPGAGQNHNVSWFCRLPGHQLHNLLADHSRFAFVQAQLCRIQLCRSVVQWHLRFFVL